MRIGGRVALLVVLWLLAWGELTAANVVSGIVVASALLVAFPPARRARPGPALSARGIARLGTYVVAQLVVSNVVMAREIVRRRVEPKPAVLTHRLKEPSDEVVTIMTTIISLSPGTMTVDVTPDSTVIHVHFYHVDDVAEAHAGLERLERLVRSAIAARPHHPHHPPSPAPETS